MPSEILIPLINPNEPEAVLTALFVQEGQAVTEDDVLCTIETTKAAADVTCEASGYIAGLQRNVGDTLRAGDLLCYIAETPDWKPPEPAQPAQQDQESASDVPVPDGMRITQPALALARQHGLDLNSLPQEILITEAQVRQYLEKSSAGPTSKAIYTIPASDFNPTEIVVYGGGGHGKSLVELLRAMGSYQIVGFIDDSLQAGSRILSLPVLGGGEALAELYQRGVRLAVNAVGGIGNVNIRIQIFRRLAEAGFTCPAVVHPTAYLEPSASLAAGVQVFPHAYVGSDVLVGFGTIINTGAIVSHDCVLGDFVNISPGAILAGGVQVGSGALIGMGVTVNLGVHIGHGARVGNGATVKSDVGELGLVRAGSVYPE